MTFTPWFSFYPGDYGRDTGHLSMVEDGAYRRLLDHYYSTGAPLPLSKDAIYRVCRATHPYERRAINKVLEQFFCRREDGYHNRRADRELTKRTSVLEARPVTSKAAGLANTNSSARILPRREQEKARKTPETPRREGQNHLSTGSPPPQSHTHTQTTKEKSPRDTPARLPDHRKEAMKNRMKKDAEAKREAHIGTGPSPIRSIVREHSIPGPMSERQVNERLAVLRKQAEEITNGPPYYGCRSLRIEEENREKERAVNGH